MWVVDFSYPSARWAAGYPKARWDPIPACVDHTIAHRRAEALVTGVDTNSDRGSDSDRFFRSSASEVLAAWLHAAALGDRGIDDLLDWMRHPDDPTPPGSWKITPTTPTPPPSSTRNLATHLDTRASKTTSGVLRYLALALNSVATADGRALCTPDAKDREGLDMAATIEAGGTVYLLADPNRIDPARPLLSLFVAEMFMAAEAVALRKPGKRLQAPFIAVLDELRYGVTVPNLPYVAGSQRKYGIGFVYSAQSSSQEEAVYGKDSAALATPPESPASVASTSTSPRNSPTEPGPPRSSLPHAAQQVA